MPARDPVATILSPPPAHQSSFNHHQSPSSSAFSRISNNALSTSPLGTGLGDNGLVRRAPSSSDRTGIGIGIGLPETLDTTSDPSIPPSSQSIRDSTNRLASLSSMSFNSPRPRALSASDSSNFLRTQRSFSPSSKPPDAHRPVHPSHLARISTVDEEISPPSPRRPVIPVDDNSGLANEDWSPEGSSSPLSTSPRMPGTRVARSGLSVMLAREDRRRAADASRSPPIQPITSPMPESIMPILGSPTSVSSQLDKGQRESPPRTPVKGFVAEIAEESDEESLDSGLRRILAEQVMGNDGMDERTPLLGISGGSGRGRLWDAFGRRVTKVSGKELLKEAIVEPVKALPSVILGTLLNVLDGVSYGMILFPANPVFEDFGSLGVSMFFMSCIVSQLVFSLGGSIFPGGNGSMMIEAVPFFHILVNIIQAECGDDAIEVISTTMAAFAFSSILTGFVFFALGAFKLGTLIGYFPRHILVGCIGGVGIFLIETGLEVSLGLKSEGFEYNLGTLRLFFSSSHAILLWTIPLTLAILLRVITHFFHHQLIFPAYFFVIPIVFYVVVLAGRLDFADLRETGWVFDVGKNTQAWWKFYTLFDFAQTNWGAFWAAMPTQLALVFFGILHVPLNVPALGVSLGEDNVKLDRELVAHGISNFAAGLTGTVPNYLTYVNTVLFYRVGGGSRLSGIMLAIMTALIMFVGPTVIGYLPVMVVGALIFVLGIDLTIEAVWDTRHRVNKMEYITIWAIAIGMTVWDFVIGLLFGIVLACIFFVVQSSRRRAIRAVFNGSNAKSTVRRPKSQRGFLQKVGSQTYVMKLQGFLFFGTISTVEEEIRKLLDLAKWQHNPIRFLIIDFTLVHGLDFSSAEAFVRVQRLLAAKDVLLIMCGAAPNGLVGTALRNVGLWADREGTRVEVFGGLNDALEWSENAYLTAFYANQKSEESGGPMDFPAVAKPPFALTASFQNSPRRSHLAQAGDDYLPFGFTHTRDPSHAVPIYPQPLPTLLQTFTDYLPPVSPSQESITFFRQLAPYFSPLIIPSHHVLWTQGEQADGLYLIESGSLRATYAFDDYPTRVEETMVAGTIAGDLSTLSDTRRNATVVSERECVLWKLDSEALGRLEKEKPDVARQFVQIVLKAVAEEQEVLSAHLIAMLS
ncbi:hypothetical protein TREMEDRAFT_71395 [Tremella mesenterica DSM 1558]|uniref:uncharacterized protein n=1 Tax=Tremella mesenterica (strain ATCC 24925 / CBS 8224 / DSM 1558 / NBRC 9311 / NRRL Y-6157 / RJB 2259-6 / UBC 559-6) TaxID=578456 RepID=UPI0003F4A531|nr:uncharacterized protein TREMEDRAFT_71395 [Tremella mesenterica DSM 1558]EIW70854.1 hypothetical protein TREMEDRAFT_71395 [Tremella mesenterica DSM 1558]